MRRLLKIGRNSVLTNRALQFIKLMDEFYRNDVRNEQEYPHPNPMKQDPDETLNTANLQDLFDQIQFPINYNFFQDDFSGVVQRTFAEPAFRGGGSSSLRDKIFILANAETGKQVDVQGCGGTRLKLNAHDQIECVGIPEMVLEVKPKPNGIPVDGSWEHPDGSTSKYFEYDKDQWEQYFGTWSYKAVVDVKQCRDGAEVWNGEVQIFNISGRRNSGYAQGQWEEHDYVVKVCAYCDD